MNRFAAAMRRLGLIALPVLVAACAAPKDATSLAEVTPDKVMVVGQIDLVPALTREELDIRLGTIDPFDSKSVFQNRAVFHLSSKPGPRAKALAAFNPRLGETFFFAIPRNKPYVVDAYVMKRAGEDMENILIPVPFKLDIRPGDSAIYIGTIRLHRDEFNEVTKVEFLDNSRKAAADFKAKFGPQAVFRKAALKAAQGAD